MFYNNNNSQVPFSMYGFMVISSVSDIERYNPAFNCIHPPKAQLIRNKSTVAIFHLRVRNHIAMATKFTGLREFTSTHQNIIRKQKCTWVLFTIVFF